MGSIRMAILKNTENKKTKQNNKTVSAGEDSLKKKTFGTVGGNVK